MIAQLAEMAYRKAGQMFFCVQKDARSVTFSYRRARFAAPDSQSGRHHE